MRAWRLITIAAVTALAGVLLVFMQPSGGIPLTIDLPTPGICNLFLTTQREIGLALVWVASVLASVVAGRTLAHSTRPRTDRVVLIVAITLVPLGSFLAWMLPNPGGIAFDVGSFSHGEGIVFLSVKRTIGFALIWVSSLLVAAVVGQRLALRSPHMEPEQGAQT